MESLRPNAHSAKTTIILLCNIKQTGIIKRFTLDGQIN